MNLSLGVERGVLPSVVIDVSMGPHAFLHLYLGVVLHPDEAVFALLSGGRCVSDARAQTTPARKSVSIADDIR